MVRSGSMSRIIKAFVCLDGYSVRVTAVAGLKQIVV
jgi:hypothetical protein